MIGTW